MLIDEINKQLREGLPQIKVKSPFFIDSQGRLVLAEIKITNFTEKPITQETLTKDTSFGMQLIDSNNGENSIRGWRVDNSHNFSHSHSGSLEISSPIDCTTIGNVFSTFLGNPSKTLT